ncbi:hypothetical protein [Marivita sp.]
MVWPVLPGCIDPDKGSAVFCVLPSGGLLARQGDRIGAFGRSDIDHRDA